MFDPSIKKAIRETALLAFECADKLNEQQLEAVMITLVETGTDKEAELAATQLFHKQEARKAQLTLKAIVEGIGGKSDRDGDMGGATP